MEPTSTAADLIAGFISGAVSTLAVHPIDTVLTRFQAGGGVGGKTPLSVSSPSAAAATASGTSPASAARNPVRAAAMRPSPPPTNPASAAVVSISMSPSAAIAESRAMIAAFGPASLWRGAPVLIGAAPFQNALLMAGYGVGRRWSGGGEDGHGNETGSVVQDQDHERLRDVFIGGVVGGVLQCFVASPAELIKVRKQVRDMLQSAVSKNGQAKPSSLSSLPNPTAGLGATMLRDGLPHGVWFASYEWCKNALGRRVDTKVAGTKSDSPTNTTVVPLVSGAFAATVAWGVGYPFDLIKTRIQAGRASGIRVATKDIIGNAATPEAALRNLYRGFELKLARAVPASAIGFVVYEKALAVIESLM